MSPVEAPLRTGAFARVLPRRWNARLWLPGLRVEVAQSLYWPALAAEPLVEVVLQRGDRARWEREPPALAIAEATTTEELADLVRRALRDEVSALLFAPAGAPALLDEEARQRRGLVRVIGRAAGEPPSKVVKRASGAVEALVRARMYRQLRQLWLDRKAACEAELAARDALPFPPRRDVVERAPLCTSVWAHANEVAGFVFPTDKVARKLEVVSQTACRVRAQVPEALRVAVASDPAVEGPPDVDAVRKALQRAEEIVRGLEDDLRALQLGGVGDPAVTQKALGTAAKAEALAITGSKAGAAARLGIDRKGFRARRAEEVRAG